ncbi:MAG: efflux RND transporter periplasmic adaptor subunit [Planctomycetes bacterium]|nr:efflux RND transporter periplasmic adaptor subunit [Planctomycetota bacterium]
MAASRPSLLFFSAIALALAACSVQTSDDGDKAHGLKKREKVRVRTALVEQREMVRTLSTTTVVESEHEIMIYPRASGQVTELRCEEGDRVKTGDVLAVLDRRATQALLEEAKIAVREAEDNVRKADLQRSESESRIAAAQIRLDQAERDFERNDKAGLVSAQALDNLRVARDTAKNEIDTLKLATQRSDVESKAARTALEKSKLALERAALDDSFMQVVAPFDGVIAKRTVKVGDSVSASAPLFVLTDTHNLRAVFYRPQRELTLFLAADKARNDGALSSTPPLEIRVVAEALPAVVFSGELQIVSPSIDPQSGSFRVTVKLGAPLSGPSDARLLPGMLVRLEVVTERHPSALVVPKRALRREGEQNLVFAVVEGKARKIEVTEGFTDDLYVEVNSATGALRPGMHVVVVGNRELEDGAEVIEDTTGIEADAKKD